MNRRQFLKSSGTLGLLGGLGLTPWDKVGAFAAEMENFIKGPPVKPHPLRQLSRRVWMIYSPDGFPTPENMGMMCNLTFVDTARGIVVVDSGASLQIGEMAIRELRKRFKKPVIAIINSHYHGDHWLGNHAFVEAYGKLPIYAHQNTVEAIKGLEGSTWRTLMEKWTNQATAGTQVIVPNTAAKHGDKLRFGDTTLRLHHYGKAHTAADICVEVVEDKVVHVGDVAMDRRIANMDDGSYVGTLKTYSALETNTKAVLWVPGHGQPSAHVLQWNRELFEGIYRPCEQAIKEGLALEEAKALVLKDPRVSSRAQETKGFETNIGKYVSLAYLEAEAAAF